MVNVDKLKGKLVECRLAVEDAAKLIGMNKGTLYRRLNGGGGTFTIAEADKLASVLGLTAEELNKIFLPSMLHNSRHPNHQPHRKELFIWTHRTRMPPAAGSGKLVEVTP